MYFLAFETGPKSSFRGPEWFVRPNWQVCARAFYGCSFSGAVFTDPLNSISPATYLHLLTPLFWVRSNGTNLQPKCGHVLAYTPLSIEAYIPSKYELYIPDLCVSINHLSDLIECSAACAAFSPRFALIDYNVNSTRAATADSVYSFFSGFLTFSFSFSCSFCSPQFN